MFVVEPTLGILPAPDKWVVRSPGIWKSPDLEATIPVGFVTDLASIPKLLRNVLDVDGRSRLPALLHDSLYCCQETTRAFADAQLRAALVAYGETNVGAMTYWLGVRAGGWSHWGSSSRAPGLTPDDFDGPDSYRLWVAGGAKVVTRWQKP